MKGYRYTAEEIETILRESDAAEARAQALIAELRSTTTKFKLFMGRLGNGVTVCNSAVQEHGDYKRIAHIAECGKIKWYIDPRAVPADDLERIERTAADEREKWEKHLSGIGEARAYGYLLDNVPHADFMHVVRDMKEASRTEQIEYLKSAYVKAAW